MLEATIFTSAGVGVWIAFGSTPYFTAKQNAGRVKSSVDDLIMERGTVSTRVAFVLRSAEVQPTFCDLCCSLFLHRGKQAQPIRPHLHHVHHYLVYAKRNPNGAQSPPLSLLSPLFQLMIQVRLWHALNMTYAKHAWGVSMYTIFLSLIVC
jgi:hypothetical protein